MPRDAQDFVTRHTAEVEPLDRQIGLAYWDASLSGKPEDFERVAQLEKKSVDIYSREDEYREVKEYYDQIVDKAKAGDKTVGDNNVGITDPLLARQIDILYRAYKSYQGDKGLLKKIVELESELTREFNTFRAEHKGARHSNNALEEILRNTNDSDEAREAYEALKQVGKVAAPRVVELVELRNRHARNLGSDNYYLFSLELRELSLEKLFQLLDHLHEQTDPLFKAMKKKLDAQLAHEFSIREDELRPWHYRNPFFQEMPPNKKVNLDPIFQDKNLEALTERYYKGIGLDIAELLKRSDLYEKEGKDQHAFCIGIHTPDDVRVLCNMKPTGRWMSTMIHEFGHAVYDSYIDPGLPFLLRHPAHTLSTEAIAMLNERFLQSADFLSIIAGVDRARAEEIEGDLKRQQSDRMLVFVRWVLVMTHFERAMYEDPSQDLNSLWWEIIERYQWLDGAERRSQPDWASKIHLACAPVYYQNYLLGEMNASQMLAAIKRGITGQPIIDNKMVGDFFRNRIFFPGAGKAWNDRLAEATGEKLNPKYFLDDLKQPK